VAALFLLAVGNKTDLAVVIVVLGALAGAIRTVNYAWYCAALAGFILIDMDLPHPSNLADEGRRILFTFIGVGIAVLVMFLANLLAKRTPGTAHRNMRPRPGPAGSCGAAIQVPWRDGRLPASCPRPR
jgi:hypothetical protein